MKRLTEDELKAVAQKYPDDAQIRRLIGATKRANVLLERALWEFGSELRSAIESHLGEEPLLPGSGR